MILAIACYCLFNDNRNGDDSLDFVPIHTRCPNSPPSTVSESLYESFFNFHVPVNLYIIFVHNTSQFLGTEKVWSAQKMANINFMLKV